MPFKLTLLTFLSLLSAVAFYFVVRLDLLRQVPGFYCESFGCIGLGVMYLGLGLVVIPLLFALGAYLMTRRFRYTAVVALISLGCMSAAFAALHIVSSAETRAAVVQAEQEEAALFEQIGLPSAQMQQDRPLLDPQRPLTIVNQLDGVQASFGAQGLEVRVYATDDAVPDAGTLTARLWVFVPGTTEKRDISEILLRPQDHTAPDGRRVFVGTFRPGDAFGADRAQLVVTGREGVFEALDVVVLAP